MARPRLILRAAPIRPSTVVASWPNTWQAADTTTWHQETVATGLYLSWQAAVAWTGSSVVITRGPEGMSLFRQGHPTQHVVAAARIIFDVTGAGDTVISMLAAALAAQASLEEAMWLASHSAAVVVGKRGTATLTLPELQAVLENQ